MRKLCLRVKGQMNVSFLSTSYLGSPESLSTTIVGFNGLAATQLGSKKVRLSIALDSLAQKQQLYP